MYGYILCMIHMEDVHEGSMIFELGEVRWKRIQMHSSTVWMAHAKAIVAYRCPWQDKPTMTAESPATLWMKVGIWGKSSNMNSLIHGVYSNYTVIDLAEYIFRSAFRGGLLELHCCHVPVTLVTLALTCQSDLFPVATWRLIRPWKSCDGWCCSSERNVVT